MKLSLILILLFINLISCNSKNKERVEMSEIELENYSQITLGAGCFWCVEAVFQRLEGVSFVESGYANGNRPNPTYEQVCTGTTGYVEVAKIYFDPEKISINDILEVFWKTHDPTTLNRQGNDIGTQYRSGIYYTNDNQKEIAEFYKNELDNSGIFTSKIVTEIEPLKNYYKAENYHQNYYNDNKNQPYCTFVINPKIEKLEKLFKEKLKNK
jgi:peptide-methionine (S)-S-oxide reductase